MKKVLCSILPILCIVLLVAVVSGSVFAQLAPTPPPQIPTVPTADFTTNYFANNIGAAPDATLRYTSHYGGFLNNGVGSVRLCANIYVFAADQQESACCSCEITPNGLVTTSVKALTSNPLTGPGTTPADGVVQIISSVYTGTCDPTFGIAGGTDPSPIVAGIDSWQTHIQNKYGTTYPITETEGTEELLTTGEVLDLALGCAMVEELGSGQGVCPCGTEK